MAKKRKKTKARASQDPLAGLSIDAPNMIIFISILLLFTVILVSGLIVWSRLGYMTQAAGF